MSAAEIHSKRIGASKKTTKNLKIKKVFKIRKAAHKFRHMDGRSKNSLSIMYEV